MSFWTRPDESAYVKKDSQLLRLASISFHDQSKIPSRKISVCFKRLQFETLSVIPRKIAQQWSRATFETVISILP